MFFQFRYNRRIRKIKLYCEEFIKFVNTNQIEEKLEPGVLLPELTNQITTLHNGMYNDDLIEKIIEEKGLTQPYNELKEQLSSYINGSPILDISPLTNNCQEIIEGLDRPKEEPKDYKQQAAA